MANFLPKEYTQQEWTLLSEGFCGLDLPQTWAYARAKSRTGNWSVVRGAIVNDGKTTGVCQAVLRKFPILAGGLVWVNRGPLWRRPDDRVDLGVFAQVLNALYNYFADRPNVYLPLAPSDEPTGEIESAVRDAGFKFTDVAGWASPLFDLSPPMDDLRSSRAKKWRNSLNKAERSDMTLGARDPQSDFPEFVRVDESFLSASGFQTSETPGLLSRVQIELNEDRKMEALLAWHSNEVVAGAMIAPYGDVCEYLASPSTEQGRCLNAGQSLLWQAIVSAKQQGFRWLDVGGTDERLTPPGIFRFKSGLAGTPSRLASEIEGPSRRLIAMLLRRLVQRARLGG